ncbi:OprD family outer membrane porin [Halomonas pacifica]|uniref:OprD family outer membrane porin n=1 Tax=Bisbaumannia pacifica TaxID=77098 RepID=UPI00235875C8|nr:OprD family outer membrane porin [Halomonas pacifica]MDC8805374.1 OprD family outer membrane porin [Halomonas pacifica]
MTTRLASRLALCLVPTLALSAQASPSPDEASASLQYRNYYWDENPRDGIGPTRDEWVHGLLLELDSGEIHDTFGVELGLGAADALSVGSGADNITNLRPGDSVQDPHGIAKVTRAYLRAEFGNDHHRLRLGAGKQTRRHRLYADNTSRILPSASLGYDLAYEVGDLELYLSRIERFSRRDDSGWGDRLSTFDGREIDAVNLAGVDYALPADLRLEAEYLESDDYLRQGLVRLSHQARLGEDLTLHSQVAHGRQEDAGERFETQGIPGLYPAADGHDARYNEFGLRLTHRDKYLGLAHTRVWGGNYDRLLFADDHGHWDSAANNFYRFGLEGEAMWKVSTGLGFADLGLPGLRWDGHYAVSDEATGFSDFSRREWQSVLQYRFAGALDGLSLAWLYVNHDTDGEPAAVDGKAPTFGPAGLITHEANRLYLTYRYAF